MKKQQKFSEICLDCSKKIPGFSYLKNYLAHYPFLWHLDLQSTARGIAVGLFVAMIPLLSFQTIMLVMLAIVIRGNLLLAFLVSWISNPITILPLAYLTYQVGNFILYQHMHVVNLSNLQWGISGLIELWSAVGIPFFIGLPIVAFGAAFAGYFTVLLIGYLMKILG